MNGNSSLLDLLPYLNNCADPQVPLVISIILGLPANMYVMWLILAGRGDKAAEIFVLNLAVCDIAICMANALLLITMNTAVSNAAFLTYIWCIIRFSFGFLVSGRPLFMSWICLERYLAVIHPVTFRRYKPLRYRLAGTMISWLTVLVSCIVLLWLPYPTIYYVCFSIAFSFFLVQLFCCVQTLKALVRPGPGEQNQERISMNIVKRTAFIMILIVIASEALTYLPYVISMYLFSHFSKEAVSKLFCATNYITLMCALTPPLLYIYRSGKLQNCIRSIINPST